MERIYLDTSGLPNSIPVRSELPNSIYVDASDLQRVLDNFLQSLSYTITEGIKANRAEMLVRQGEVQPMQTAGQWKDYSVPDSMPCVYERVLIKYKNGEYGIDYWCEDKDLDDEKNVEKFMRIPLG